MPHLDPNIVLWATLVADTVTTLASLGGCTAAVLHYRAFLKERLKKL